MSGQVFSLYRLVEQSVDPLTIPRPIRLLDNDGHPVGPNSNVDDEPPVLVVQEHR